VGKRRDAKGIRQNTKEKIQNILNFRLWTIFEYLMIIFFVLFIFYFFFRLCGSAREFINNPKIQEK